MYTVIVVDDEPTALDHICMILEKKCRGYQIIDRADNGQSAYGKITRKRPDVVITDVKMPVMDGIELIAKVKKDYPEILSVIISGYQDFDYAKGATQSGACDYLLKPLKPADLKKLMEELMGRLAKLYYEKRRRLLRSLCSNHGVWEVAELKRCFPSGNYYSAIIRKNGLPRRFSQNTGLEIFSMEEEKFYIYGRDEMESLYLFPEELLPDKNFGQVIMHMFQREKNAFSYITAVEYEEAFTMEEFPAVIRKLYRKLDESIVIGSNQLLKEGGKRGGEMQDKKEKELLEDIIYLVKCKESPKLHMKLEKLFGLWENTAYTQLYIEWQVRYIFQMMKHYYPMAEDAVGIEFLIEDVFYYASNMKELKESIFALLASFIPEAQEHPAGGKEQTFRSIISYLDVHMDETITIGSICKEFGVSQTSLNRMFRSCQGCSFGAYLTNIRIKKAKELMGQESEVYIKDIAMRVGYGDQFYFSRIFRSVAGISPSEYLELKN